MKVLTWNVNKAGESRRELWQMVQHEDAEIVLLQEVTGIPEWIRSQYQYHMLSPRWFDDTNAKYSSAVLAKGLIDATPYLESEWEWVNRIYSEQYGWIVGCEITLRCGERFRVVAVYSPSSPIPRDQWTGQDVSGIRPTNIPDLWFTEILWALLRNAGISNDTNWIVGGDFNTSVKLDEPRDRGHREFLGRLKTLGLTDCLSHHHGGAVPTFQHARKSIEHQLDYCFVNVPMLQRLTQARVLSHEDVFHRERRLSDHLPVLCEFD
ncbi:MAG: endonuclease/exonuclease/phosphatase family protein [Bryobacterales bacterium]|nr:endonuclease/exonuclease/phosphatase family protein [Bryobacterales bacterium]